MSSHQPENFRARIDAYLKDPLSFPREFTNWVIGWIDQNPPTIPPPRNRTVNTVATTASVAAGTATVNVTHGLGVAPLRVFLNPTSDTQGLRWWVSAKGASTFTITLSGNAVTNPVTFDWSAEF